MPFVFTTGFNIWKNIKSDPQTKPLASGTSVAMNWILLDNAWSLNLTATIIMLTILTF